MTLKKNKKKSRDKRRGFTLIELLVVIAIISLLVSILLPSLKAAKTLATKTLCQVNLKHINQAVALYMYDFDETYPCAVDPLIAPGTCLWMGRGFRELTSEYVLASAGSGKSILYCPADPAAKTFDNTSYAYSMAFYYGPEQINNMINPSAINLYDICFNDTTNSPPPFEAQRIGDVAQPSRKILIGEWVSNHQITANDNGWWCWEGKRNYLFADGSIKYLAATDIAAASDNTPNPNLTIDGIKGSDR